MKNFACTHCGNEVYFENIKCLRCHHALGFEPGLRAVVALRPAGRGSYRIAGEDRPGPSWAYCANHHYKVCNWMRPSGAAGSFCLACALNRTIPNLSESGNLAAWRELELAKKRLVYSLLRFGLPMDGTRFGKGRLAFNFLRNATTGHLDGTITIDVGEADAEQRERQRQLFNEPYRSLLGHLRHESGHFYWMLLIEAAGRQGVFRALFGDERSEYGKALARHHADGPPKSWDDRFVSAYASAHPWEDWAETWALYMHIVDAIDTASAEGEKLRAAGLVFSGVRTTDDRDAYTEEDFRTLLDRWIPLTLAMNSLSRSLGYSDFYPFVIPPPARAKLNMVHDLVRDFVRAKEPARVADRA
jgi:hypothetical protein